MERRTLDASGRNSLDLAATLDLSLLLVILHDKAIGRLIRQTGDGSCAESIALAKEYFCVGMCMALVLAGEVQVNIRLLIALEAKERLERDIKSVFLHLRSALRAVLVRHITSGTTGIGLDLIGIEIAVLAVRADIVRTQRIYLRNVGHGCRERGSNRSTGAHQVTVLIGLLYQPLRDNIHNSVTVADDGVQAPFPDAPLQ